MFRSHLLAAIVRIRAPWLGVLLFAPTAGLHAVEGVIERTVPSAVPGRSADLCIYRPAGPGPFPVVVFSQDLGASCHAHADLGRHWAQARLLTVFVAHPGGASVDWAGRPQRRTGREHAGIAREARVDHRSGDILGVLDALGQWNREADHPLATSADLDRVGVAGAFWGAYTAEIMTGRRPAGGAPVRVDRRIRSALLLDPVGPAGLAPPSAYASVRAPWMLIWGWRGTIYAPMAPPARTGSGPVPTQFESVWRGLRTQGSYELVFRDALDPRRNERRDDGRDGRYGDRNRDAGDRDRIVRQLSTAFWNATLRNDPDARRWLNGPAARDLLRSGDRWRRR